MTNTSWFLVFLVSVLRHSSCRGSCLWTLSALIMEEYFFSASGSSLTTMCRDTNGTTTQQLLYRPASLTHLFLSLKLHSISLIFRQTASQNCLAYSTSFFHVYLYSRRKEDLHYLHRLQIAPHLITVNTQAKYASTIYSFSPPFLNQIKLLIWV